MNGEDVAKFALQAATAAWPAFASWLSRAASAAPSDDPIARKLREILPEDGESARAARVLRNG